MPGASKVLMVVLDGAADSPSSPRRALEEAYKPNIDSLASRAACGLLYVVGRGVAPESDAAVMSLLGYDPERYYTGRGPLEALGAGADFRPGDVAFRANFATVDPATGRIVDRRVGRSLSSGEARELARALDGMPLAGGEARAFFRATIGHRAVLVIRHSRARLSGMVSNSDPAYERVGRISVARRGFEPFIERVRPLSDDPAARLTAELANEFSDMAIRVLDEHPVNLERRRRGLLPANAVLLRDAGDSLPPAEPFAERFGLDGASIVEMVVERGIARALGLRDYPVDVEGKPRGELLAEEASLALKALESHGFVYVHLKGPDEPGHDGDFEGKVRAIEDIDRFFFSRILDGLPEGVVVVVTSDHATPWNIKAHSSDPVPLMVSWRGAPKGPGRYSESLCSNGGLGAIEGGWRVVPLVKRLAGL